MSERRRFYRVDDELMLAWRPLDATEVHEFRRGSLRSRMKQESLQQLVFHLDAKLESLSEALMAVDPAVREAIDILDRKLTLIERMLSQARPETSEDQADYQLTTVNLSAGGIGMEVDRPMARGAFVAIDMIMLPEYEQLELVGQVVSCRELTDVAQWSVAIDFVQLREVERDRLAAHIARRQTQILKSRRDVD